MSTVTIRKPGMIQDVGYFGSRISDNLTETKEGFLICHGVPIARTGWQKYIGREIGLSGDDANKLVDVYRSPEEVFKPETMASFRGKPFTDNHPDRDVNPDNALWLVKGVVDNVRRGAGAETNLLLADVIVYDRNLIRAILDSKKREVSCGYNCQYVRMPDGTYQQRDIHGNHVALVDEGRAGARVSIRDAASALLEWTSGRRRVFSPKATTDTGKGVNELDENDEAAKKYGIAVKKDGHRSPPEGYPADREQYGDPVNFKYPIDREHIEHDPDFFNRSGEREKGEYTSAEWRIIGERIARASTKELGVTHKYDDGHIVTEEKKGVKDRMARRRSVLDSIPRGFGVKDLFTAIGLQRFAQDAEPEEMMDALEELTAEEREDKGTEDKGRDGKGKDGEPAKDPDDKTKDGKTKDDDDDRVSSLEKKMDELMSMVKGLGDKAKDGKTQDKSADEMIDDAMKSLDEALEGTTGTSDPGQGRNAAQSASESGTAGPIVNKEGQPLSGAQALERVTDAATARAVLSSLRPALLSIQDEKERTRVTDATIQAVMGVPKHSYSQMQDGLRAGSTSAQQRAIDGRGGAYPQPGGQSAQQTRSQALDGLGMKIAQARNPQYKKQAQGGIE